MSSYASPIEQWHWIQEHWPWYISWYLGHHTWILSPVHATAEWRRRTQEQNTHWDGQNNARWIQDSKKILDWSHWYCMSYNQSCLSSQTTEQDILWAPYWQEAKCQLLQSIWCQVVDQGSTSHFKICTKSTWRFYAWIWKGFALLQSLQPLSL